MFTSTSWNCQLLLPRDRSKLNWNWREEKSWSYIFNNNMEKLQCVHVESQKRKMVNERARVREKESGKSWWKAFTCHIFHEIFKLINEYLEINFLAHYFNIFHLLLVSRVVFVSNVVNNFHFLTTSTCQLFQYIIFFK